jgi:hypothetical protein
MAELLALEYLLRRDGLIAVVAIAGVVAPAWAYLVAGAGIDTSMADMPMEPMPWSPVYGTIVLARNPGIKRWREPHNDLAPVELTRAAGLASLSKGEPHSQGRGRQWGGALKNLFLPTHPGRWVFHRGPAVQK